MRSLYPICHSGFARATSETGPGVDRKTSAAFKGTAHWTGTLKRGSYRAFSDAHPTLARTIRVG